MTDPDSEILAAGMGAGMAVIGIDWFALEPLAALMASIAVFTALRALEMIGEIVALEVRHRRHDS